MFGHSNNKSSDILLDYTAILRRKIVHSRTTLHRYLNRSADQNPFPAPIRHTVTGMRYWLESEVSAWAEREHHRRIPDIGSALLVIDSDPSMWAPRCRKTAADHPHAVSGNTR